MTKSKVHTTQPWDLENHFLSAARRSYIHVDDVSKPQTPNHFSSGAARRSYIHVDDVSKPQTPNHFSSGAARRSYIHVDDVSNAFDTILHKGTPHEIYNIGTKFEVGADHDALTVSRPRSVWA
jgi:nucleoside-diphosphate-sugar epimerase